MNRTSRFVATLAVSAAFLVPLAAPANAAEPRDNLVVSAPISLGGGSGGQVSTYGVSDAVNDWFCRNLGALCRR